MNWSDYFVIGLVALFAIIGLIKGIVMSGFKVFAFFSCIFASIKLYPAFSKMLSKTRVYTVINNSVMKSLMLRGQEASASSSVPVTGTAAAESMVGSISLPAFLKESVIQKLPKASELIDMEGILRAVGDEITMMIISVVSLILLYIILKIVMAAIGFVLKGVSKLPLVKQVDKTGGFILGAVQGILTVYIICALLVILNANPGFETIFKGLESSLFAWRFYENNFIISWMFPT